MIFTFSAVRTRYLTKAEHTNTLCILNQTGKMVSDCMKKYITCILYICILSLVLKQYLAPPLSSSFRHTLRPSEASIFTPTFVTFRLPVEDVNRPFRAILSDLPHCFHFLQTSSSPSIPSAFHLLSTPPISNVTAVWGPFQSFPHFLEELFRIELICFHFFPFLFP
jgi:hypothetical protein